jgi:hypothetical protein
LTLAVEKPIGATVREAYLAVATTGNRYTPLTTSPFLEGQPVTLEIVTARSADDVTGTTFRPSS